MENKSKSISGPSPQNPSPKQRSPRIIIEESDKATSKKSSETHVASDNQEEIISDKEESHEVHPYPHHEEKYYVKDDTVAANPDLARKFEEHMIRTARRLSSIESTLQIIL